ncbi:MAG: prepilin-type N-terminal cleavage/methylation domain-containing protein [Campylobacteraceae bacterium]|nr:prepilin-type N-terminal cleavage/methylation domain-containing protein [Campylobacteraceae bacterium]
MKKAFSLLEIIFVITLISIISIIAVPKLFLNITSASYVQIKSDIALIRSAIISNKNANIISGKGEAFITSLDESKINVAYEKLFAGNERDILLQYPLISTSNEKKELGKWIKTSNNNYKVFIDNKNAIEFIYDSNEGTFDCDYKEDLCKDLIK